MAPELKKVFDELMANHKVVLFMKGDLNFPMCGFSARAVQALQVAGAKDVKAINVLEDNDIREGVKEYSSWPTIPQLYVDGEFVGGSDIIIEMLQNGELGAMLEKSNA